MSVEKRTVEKVTINRMEKRCVGSVSQKVQELGKRVLMVLVKGTGTGEKSANNVS